MTWVDCLLGGDDPAARIDVDTIIGAYAVHKRLRRRLDGSIHPDGPEWGITHRASGVSVWITDEYAAAMRAAHWLDDCGMIPADADARALKRWRVMLAPHDAMTLVEGLQTRAPRTVGYNSPYQLENADV